MLNDIPINSALSIHTDTESKKITKPTHRRQVLNRFETAPQEGWQLIKKWVGRCQTSNNKLSVGNIERQAEMNTITPLIMAMYFTRDEHNKHRIPVFLKNIVCKVTLVDEQDEKRKMLSGSVFKITIQYGSGAGKIIWSVYRTYWDFVKLHYRYRDAAASRLPPFPSLPRHYFHKRQRKTSFNKQNQNLPGSYMDEETIMAIVNHTLHPERDGDSTASLAPSQIVDMVDPDRTVLNALEDYLNELVSSIEPCGYINRICRFLEISWIGLHLAAKYPGLHGKEGFAVLQSRTDREPKQTRRRLHNGFICFSLNPGRKKQKPKWFIVRESYLACVDDPSESEIYDVFLFDQAFEVHRLNIFGDRSNHQVKNSSKKLSNAIANASHWASGRSVLCIKNKQGVYHFRTKSERHAKQFEISLRALASRSIWCEQHRFGSFAPVCHQTGVTWFVDGRDYFWDLSVALENAKETIYIHDWWLSPFLRRPASRHPEWRLDRVLKRKAHQGIKIYIVMYKEVAVALPLYSHLAKRHLLSLSPNIYVQRHPSRALDVFHKDSIFFWAHHEKICVIDNEIAFLGGIDACFGRYDGPGHILVDDGQETIWPGKDYSNPRIIDFHTLDKPFEDNMDRSRLPRMPWHDISMRLVGSAAQHVARHFVERWNFLRRKKPAAPKRPTPMLLPVPEIDRVLPMSDSRLLHPYTSTLCQVQILRSVSPWSIGSTEHVEHSILNAYVECIKESRHFIYIENQFFVTSTKTGNTVIENGIGQAIVDRILRAKREGKKWRAIIVIPLVPGFPANIDETEATTVRLIMQCQYLSIGRGPHSLLAKLHAAGITQTHEYINFYGLRNWAELNHQYVTEQVYIHAKTMIVDDQKVITGSANINERSQLGTRDSEIAACVEDRDWVDSVLDGQPVKVARYAHSLRMRLMCEHVGLDVDQMDRDRSTQGDLLCSPYLKQPVWDESKVCDTKDTIDCLPPFVQVSPERVERVVEAVEESEEVFVVSPDSETSSCTEDEETKRVKAKVEQLNEHGGQVLTKTSSNERDSVMSPTKSIFSKRKSSKEDYLDFWTTLDCDTDNNGDRPFSSRLPEYYASPNVMPLFFESKTKGLTVGEVYEILRDPMRDDFQEFWHVLARSNTDLFRRSFLVMPDNNVKNWDQYHHFIKMAKLFLGRTDPKHGGTKTTVAAAAVTTLPIFQQGGETVHDLLKHIKGHLVIWPNSFMEEEKDNEFIFQIDKIPPIEIFD
ncbi:hypothetical protein G6F48_001936 [Rhizopus delemar]|nr:hypothetical protein G6F48_001936 [Rhizopus delemar]